MSRSIWKGPFSSKSLLKRGVLKKKAAKIWSRSSVIPALLINKSVLVHTGLTFKRVVITRDKVGYKFGAFATTRQHYKNKKDKKSKKKN